MVGTTLNCTITTYNVSTRGCCSGKDLLPVSDEHFPHSLAGHPPGMGRVMFACKKRLPHLCSSQIVDKLDHLDRSRTSCTCGARCACRKALRRKVCGLRSATSVGVLGTDRAQPLLRLTTAGRFALRASAHWAHTSLRLHWAPASLRLPAGWVDFSQFRCEGQGRALCAPAPRTFCFVFLTLPGSPPPSCRCW